MFKSLES